MREQMREQSKEESRKSLIAGWSSPVARQAHNLKVVSSNLARVIILTGDAGHGKTHLCRRILEDHLGYESDEARTLINSKCDGSHVIPHKSGDTSKTPLVILKDFSEFAIPNAAEKIEHAFNSDKPTIVCANEGRLRAVLESPEAGDGCAKLKKDFVTSFEDGMASRDGRDFIINLNYQSVAATDGNNLIKTTLHEWLSGTRWSICQRCSLNTRCPIYRNRNLLSEDSDGSEKNKFRREKLDSIFATAERLGIVITIRELFMMVAYLLTGGISCNDVKEKLKSKRPGWQQGYAFYNLLFSPPKEIKGKLNSIPVLKEFASLDPGLRSVRTVDDRLINQTGLFEAQQPDTIFRSNYAGKERQIDAADGIDGIISNPRNRSERQSESAFITEVVRSLRRRAFFDDKMEPLEMMQRLGFGNGGYFLEVISSELSPARAAILKRRILSGLHMLQGLRMKPTETNLYLVDPAFGSATSNAAIISRRINAPSIKILPMASKWTIAENERKWALQESVDWLDRHIIIRVEDEDQKPTDFELDLLLFNCVTKASGGYVAESFYSHEIRRTKSCFGRLAEKTTGRDDVIELFMEGEMRSITFDRGVILVN